MILFYVGFSDDLENGMDMVVANSENEAKKKVKDKYNLPDNIFIYAEEIDVVDGYKVVLEKI